MAAPTASQQQLRAAFSRRGFQLPADDAGSPVGAKLAALMATDGAAAASGSTKAADGLARQFEAYAMATGIAPSELTPALVEAFEREARASAAIKRSAQNAVGGGGLSWDDAADALADGTNVRLPRMGGGGGNSQKSGKTRAAAAASVRAAVAPSAAAAAAAAAATPAAAAAALSSPAAAAMTTPVHSGPRGGRQKQEASPGGSAFARRERSGEVVASLRPEIELPQLAEKSKKPAAASASAMEVDGDDEAAAEAAASAAAALDDLPSRASSATVVVELLTAAPSAGTERVLTDSLADRAAFAEARVSRFAAAFERAAAASAGSSAPAASTNGEEEENASSAPSATVGVARQTARGVFVGRVVDSSGIDATTCANPSSADADAPPPARLDLHSASLEGSATLSAGRRAKLDVSSLNHRWRLFPGQVVAVVGACPAGHTLVASALLPSAPPPRAPRSKRGEESAANEGMKVVVASGPFTAPGDVAFEALDAVLALASSSSSSNSSSPSAPSSRPADAVVLVGPFVDERHPAVSSGSLDVSFDELFEREVVGRIAEWSVAFEKKTRRSPPVVVLLPSPRDVAAGAFTSAFPAKALFLPAGTPRNIISLPNPATFRVGGIVFGATGHDVLKDLSASQAAGGLGDGSESRASASSSSSSSLPGVASKDRMAGLAGALLEQGCFYPLYPPAKGTMLDSRLALGGSESSSSAATSTSSPAYPGLSMPFSPDVLLLPSDLAAFARVAAAEAPPALRVDGSGELISSAAAAPSSSASVPPPLSPQPGVEAVAVNPGRAVTAGGGGGTAAVVILGARSKEKETKEGEDVVSRCRVDIVRL